MAERKDFFSSTVEEVASVAKVSVGAFYERFESKETFFSALQEIVATRIELAVRARIVSPNFVELGYEDAVRAIVGAWITAVRLHRGLIRASLRHLPVRDDAWFPLRRLGERMVEIYADELQLRLPQSARGGLKHKVRVALQFVHGVVVNIILNNPGPMGLDADELEDCIRKVINLFVNTRERPNRSVSRFRRMIRGAL